jgi:hypothetical protein
MCTYGCIWNAGVAEESSIEPPAPGLDAREIRRMALVAAAPDPLAGLGGVRTPGMRAREFMAAMRLDGKGAGDM